MLQPARLTELVLFDLFHSLSSMRNIIFIIPYFLFWFIMFYSINAESIDWLKSIAGIAAASWFLGNNELASTLILERSAIISLYLIVSIVVMPVFVMFVTNNPFSSHLANGTFRFLSTRVSRNEIYFSRIFSSFLVISLCLLFTTIWGTVIAIIYDDKSLTEIIVFAFQTWLILVIYSIPFISFVSCLSSITRSGMSNLFLSITIYTILVFIILGFYKDYEWITFLLPSGVRPYMLDMSFNSLMITLGVLSTYTLLFGSVGWWRFSKQDI
ncbi:MAG: hypothetical protein AAF410_05910 [Pseudomonadota bacterium]